jgi:hypothetical protein
MNVSADVALPLSDGNTAMVFADAIRHALLSPRDTSMVVRCWTSVFVSFASEC